MSDNIGPSSVEKALNIAARILLCDGNPALRQIAHDLDISVPSAYRYVATLQNCGILTRIHQRSYAPGPALLAIASRCSKREIVRRIAKPILAELSVQRKGICHMGTWDNGMVTYIIKCADENQSLFTRETMQLEGYASALGKALLSTFDNEYIECYLNDGELINLTSKTIVDKIILKDEIMRVRKNNFSIDDEEYMDGLNCVAIPLIINDKKLPLAVSISRRKNINDCSSCYRRDDIRGLRKAGKLITEKLNLVLFSGAQTLS